MRHILTLVAVVLATACFGQEGDGYTLEIETIEAQASSGFVHKFYVTANDPTDKISTVFGNDQKPLVISAPEGIFNASAGSWSPTSSWLACGDMIVNTSCLMALEEDSYATIGLDGPAQYVPGAQTPSLVQDAALSPTVSQFFQSGGTSLNVNSITGASWYVLSTASNALPDENGRWLIMQLTSPGPITGTLNVQVFPLGNGADQIQKTFDFSLLSGCTDESACNYDPNATDDFSCDFSCCPGPGCCGTGTYWDASSQSCLAYPVPPSNTNPSDVNMDGCVGIDDFLVHLSNFGSGCDVPQWACGDMITFLGDEYSTVQIGEQCWFQENLRYLPSIHPGEFSSTNPRYYVYGHDDLDLEAAKQTESYLNHGVLYNWPAAMQDGICPVGWHLPTSEELVELVEASSGVVAPAGELVSLQELFSGPFEGALSGVVGADGVDMEGSEGTQMWLWTQDGTSEGDMAHSLSVYAGIIGYLQNEAVSMGQSVRCIQDSE